MWLLDPQPARSHTYLDSRSLSTSSSPTSRGQVTTARRDRAGRRAHRDRCMAPRQRPTPSGHRAATRRLLTVRAAEPIAPRSSRRPGRPSRPSATNAGHPPTRPCAGSTRRTPCALRDRGVRPTHQRPTVHSPASALTGHREPSLCPAPDCRFVRQRSIRRACYCISPGKLGSRLRAPRISSDAARSRAVYLGGLGCRRAQGCDRGRAPQQQGHREDQDAD